jgi:hypothetical protein
MFRASLKVAILVTPLSNKPVPILLYIKLLSDAAAKYLGDLSFGSQLTAYASMSLGFIPYFFFRKRKAYFKAFIGNSCTECLCLVHLSSSLAKTNSPSTITPTAESCTAGQLKPITTVIKTKKQQNK